MAEAVSKIARPYAKAVFQLAKEQQKTAEWSAFLNLVASIAVDKRVKQLLQSPAVTAEQLAEFFIATSESMQVEKSNDFINLLAERKRLAVLPAIASIYEAFRSDAERSVVVQVSSAMAIENDQLQQLKSKLEQRLDRHVELECEIEPGLLGGAVIRAGDLVIDGSVKSQLALLQERMTA